MNKAILLDRDGTINEDLHDYIKSANDFRLLPRAYGAFQKLGYLEDFLLVTLTNQSGINKGLYSLGELDRIHRKMEDLLELKFHGIYFCPHAKEENCSCRKPKQGLLEKAVKELSIDVSKSYLIGDKTSDIKLGKDAGCYTIGVKTGHGVVDKEYEVEPDILLEDLYEAVDYILTREKVNLAPKGIDLSKVKRYSIKDRKSKVRLENLINLDLFRSDEVSDFLNSFPDILASKNLRKIADSIAYAKGKNKKVLFMLGAHVIKTGLSPLVNELLDNKVIDAIALNGAGIIHDVELSLYGFTSEDVMDNLKDGSFGMAIEPNDFINNAVSKANKEEGLGYIIGKSIVEAKAPYLNYSILGKAYQLKIPVTVHSIIGAEITYQHPSMNAAAMGNASYNDFKKLIDVVSGLKDGAVVNFGSAVVLPEVFLKALSTTRNLGYEVNNFTAANFDMIQHYRPNENVVRRPTENNLSGNGYSITGHHEIMMPLLARLILNRIRE